MSPILFVFLAIFVLFLCSGVYVFVLACCAGRKVDWLDEDRVKKTPYGIYYDCIQASHRWLKEHNAQDVYIKSQDGLRLHGFWIPADRPRGTVLMAHGYRSTMLIDFHLAFELFHRLGMNILVPEQRTHGQSGGKYITFGVKESRDMCQWLEFHHNEMGDYPVVLYGISMGASTMLYLADQVLPGAVKGIIADCGFTSPAQIISSVYRSVIHLPGWISLWVAGIFTRIFAGFGLWEKDTRKILKNSRYPVLLIHGGEDGFVRCEMSKEAFAECKEPKKLLIVEKADHGLSFVVDGFSYTAAIMEFLDNYLEM